MADIEKIHQKLEMLRRMATERDQRFRDVHDVRAGKVETLMPGAFPDAWPKPIVANVIDTTARDLAEVIAPLPSVNCASGVMTSQRGKNFASKRTKVANFYIIHSELKTQMMRAADWYITYGMVPFVVEPDFENKTPHIRFDDPTHAYPEFDLWGRIVSYTKVWREEAGVLATKFPDLRARILGPDPARSKETKLEVVKYCDKDRYVMYLPERHNQVIMEMDNPFGKVPVVIACRPAYDKEVRGSFDDVIWVHLARARMALLGMEATEKTVRAPIALPTDVQKMSFGDDAIIRTNSPEKIRRVGIDVPQAALQLEQLLQSEVRSGARSPAVRNGESDASIVTGRGVQALMGGFDTQVKAAQTVLGRALERTLMLCFEMDEKFWPNDRKSIRGVVSGTPFEVFYTAGQDIAGNYTVDVSYGFASGLDPSRALVFLLQLRGDQLVSRDFVQRQLPMDLDVAQLQVQIDNEQTTDALKQGLYAMLQSIGVMAEQGQDPTQILFKAAKVIELREKGKSMSESIIESFQPPKEKTPPPGFEGQPEEGGPGAEAGPGGEGQPGQIPAGLQASGLASGVAPGQAGQSAGGRPDLQMLLAGLSSSGKPNLSANVRRGIPA